MIEGVPRGLTLFRFRSGSRARVQFVATPRLGLQEGDERREDAGCARSLARRYRCVYASEFVGQI